jgi:hypothetical protein
VLIDFCTELKSSTSNSWLGRWWNRGSSNTPGPVKANLGEEVSFYYDKELKRWVNKNVSYHTYQVANSSANTFMLLRHRVQLQRQRLPRLRRQGHKPLHQPIRPRRMAIANPVGISLLHLPVQQLLSNLEERDRPRRKPYPELVLTSYQLREGNQSHLLQRCPLVSVLLHPPVDRLRRHPGGMSGAVMLTFSRIKMHNKLRTCTIY